MKISVMSGGFRLGLEAGVRRAAAIGAQGVQIYAGELGLDFAQPLCRPCAEGVRSFVAAQGLQISAVCVELGGFAGDPALIPGRIETTLRMIELADALGVEIVTGHIGRVPADRADPKYLQIKEAMLPIAAKCEKHNMVYAIETGPEKAPVLRGLLEDIGGPGLGVNFDPANLVMCSDDDPVAAVRTLAPYIKHVHAKDGICLSRPVHKPWPQAPAGAPWIEVPLGQGEVDFPRFIDALRIAGYNGFLAIEREAGENPEEDIRAALHYLKAVLGQS